MSDDKGERFYSEVRTPWSFQKVMLDKMDDQNGKKYILSPILWFMQKLILGIMLI